MYAIQHIFEPVWDISKVRSFKNWILSNLDHNSWMSLELICESLKNDLIEMKHQMGTDLFELRLRVKKEEVSHLPSRGRWKYSILYPAARSL